MKQKPLDSADFAMWMSESFTMYACNSSTREGRLMLSVNHYATYRVTLGESIIYEGDLVTAALDAYNSHIS